MIVSNHDLNMAETRGQKYTPVGGGAALNASPIWGRGETWCIFVIFYALQEINSVEG